mgnify:FL=1
MVPRMRRGQSGAGPSMRLTNGVSEGIFPPKRITLQKGIRPQGTERSGVSELPGICRSDEVRQTGKSRA